MTVNFNMLGAFMEDRVPSELKSRLTVTVKGDRTSVRNPEFSQQPNKPSNLSSSLGHGTVFSFSGAFGNSGLLLGLPTDRRSTKQEHIASN